MAFLGQGEEAIVGGNKIRSKGPTSLGQKAHAMDVNMMCNS